MKSLSILILHQWNGSKWGVKGSHQAKVKLSPTLCNVAFTNVVKLLNPNPLGTPRLNDFVKDWVDL